MIIGSGAGGGTLTNELAQKGIDAGAANPTLTIVALAIRQAEYVSDKMSAGEI